MMSRRSTGPAQRGVSLVEALVALVVMAFGVLGVVGLQATLRNNADVSRQRGEAVRIAQARIEQHRSYVKVGTDAGIGYADILTAPGQLISPANANTPFRLYQDVSDAPAGRGKTVLVRVEWRDRTSTTDNQTVTFATLIARVPPELAGTLTLPADASRLATPGLRNPAIPVEAVAVPDQPGRSRFAVPGTTVSYVFDNTSGEIVSICSPAGTCAPASAWLLSGYVRFATGLGRAPIASDAEIPPGPLNLDAWPLTAAGTGYVTVRRSDDQPDVDCYHRIVQAGSHVEYFCAVPRLAPNGIWSGRTEVHPPNLASAGPPDTRNSSAHSRVCRYAPGPAPTRNVDHPAAYVNVTGALTNQNFLVIDAGSGIAPYTCPADDPDTALNTATWLHQPTPTP